MRVLYNLSSYDLRRLLDFMKLSAKYKPQYNMIISFGIIMVIRLFLYYILGYAPFGEKSLIVNDAHIQYVDFFAYLKDVLSGENSIAYSFSKTLGGSCIGVFSYYLASPFNLLLLFVEKTSIYTFFHIIIALKLSLAGATFAYFLNIRFREFLSEKKYGNFLVVVLSVSYALGQYSLAQSSNVKWLEGVYFLPLILTGVYEVVQKKSSWKLSLFVGLAILFNWYTGGISCLFSIFWFFMELCLKQTDKNNRSGKDIAKESFELLIRYGCAMALGVVLSAVLFLPTIGALRNSTRGSLDLSVILNPTFMGELPSVIQGYSLGAISGLGYVSLFCGTLALIGTIGCFISKEIHSAKKLVLGVFAGFSILMYYWQPLFGLFSLLKTSESFFYRYSYCSIFTLVFLAAMFFFTTNYEKKPMLLVKIAGVFAATLLMMNYFNHMQDVDNTNTTAIYMVLIACGLAFFIYSMDKSKVIKGVALTLVTILLLGEVTLSSKLLMEYYSSADYSYYRTYVMEQEAQMDELQIYDDSFYRISQTTTRSTLPDNITAYYNDGLAYGYWSISGYTSSPDDIQREFLDRLGYPINGENMCIVNTSIVGADALLGVKYVLSPYAINGLELIEELGVHNGKAVYENPYSLPMAFVYDDNTMTVNNESNPFVYQNELYSKLLGESVELYEPLQYVKTDQIYTVTIPEGNYAVYGNLPWQSYANAKINVNGYYDTTYASWLSPSVFYIPTNPGDQSAVVTVSAANVEGFISGTEQIYALNLDKLAEVAQKISSRTVDTMTIENGYANITVNATEGEKLYISIPYDAGWKITLNGQEIQPELFGDCMYTIALEDGSNEIEMSYSIPFLNIGIVVSMIGLIVLVIIMIVEKKGKGVILCQTKSNA